MVGKASSVGRSDRARTGQTDNTEWGRLPVAQQQAGGVGSRTIWRWASQGLIRVSRVGRITVFDLASIRRLIEKNATGGEA